MSIYEDAQAIQQRANDAYEKIRNNPTLSLAGKQRMMAPHALRAKADIGQLSWSAKQHRQQRVADLKRKTFGVAGNANDPMAQMSYRDAVARAAELDEPNKAQFAMDRAIESGDEVMARALAQSAIDRGWIQMAQGYVDVRPEVGEALSELNELANYDKANLLNEAFYMHAPLPDELHRHTDYDLQTLAESPMPEQVLPPQPAQARVGGTYG